VIHRYAGADDEVLVELPPERQSLVASKKFYPPQASTPEGRLRFYATQFPLVEVDTSYYAIPPRPTAQAWADRTPGHFTFNVKAFRLFTGHATSPQVLPPDLRAELPALQKPTFYLDCRRVARRGSDA
jgi:uncharacterized protein YecE (DUF72 family)